MSSTESPSFVKNIKELQQEGLLDCIQFAMSKIAGAQESVTSLVSFLGTAQNMEQAHKEAGVELSQKVVELTAAILGMQSAARLQLDDQSKSGRKLQRTMDNISWQLSGTGKGVNSSTKDLVLSLARLLQAMESQRGKAFKMSESNAETLEAMEAHLGKISERIQTLVQQGKGPMGQTPPLNPQVNPASAAATTAATLGTGKTAVGVKATPEECASTTDGEYVAPAHVPPQVAPNVVPTMPPMGTPQTPGWGGYEQPHVTFPPSPAAAVPEPLYKRVKLHDGTEVMEPIG